MTEIKTDVLDFMTKAKFGKHVETAVVELRMSYMDAVNPLLRAVWYRNRRCTENTFPLSSSQNLKQKRCN